MNKRWIIVGLILLGIVATVTFKMKSAHLGADKGTVADSSSAPSHDVQNPAQSDHVTQVGPDGKPIENANVAPEGASSATGEKSATGAEGSVAGGSVGAGTIGTTQTAAKDRHATGSNGAPSEAVNEDKNCFAYEYHHKKEAKNRDIEDFMDFTNAFPVAKGVNSNSICVKVNNKPVAFRLIKNKNQDEVMIGSVVGPDSLIRVSYCVGAANCKEACAIKSNRYMDELMSDAGDDDDFKDSWDGNENTAQKKELKAKVKELRNVASENSDLSKQSVMRTWDTVQKQEWVCRKK